jgi:hypothetical protein
LTSGLATSLLVCFIEASDHFLLLFTYLLILLCRVPVSSVKTTHFTCNIFESRERHPELDHGTLETQPLAAVSQGYQVHVRDDLIIYQWRLMNGLKSLRHEILNQKRKASLVSGSLTYGCKGLPGPGCRQGPSNPHSFSAPVVPRLPGITVTEKVRSKYPTPTPP